MFVFLLWIKEAFFGLFRNIWWNTAAFLLSLVCLIAFSVFFAAGGNAEFFSDNLNQKLEIQVDIKEGSTNYVEMKQRIEQDARITGVTFVSKDEAQAKFVEEMGKDATVLQLFEENIFPAQYIVKVGNVEHIDAVAKNIEEMGFSERVLYGKEYMSRLIQFTDQFQKIGMYGTIIFSLFVVFLMMYVIQMNIEQRKDEIRIKQLIGSSMLTVRAPFILEAIILVCGASAISYYGFIYLYEKLIYFLTEQLPALEMLDVSIVKEQLMIPLFVLAIVLGVFGSLFATGRHLKRL